MNLDLDTMTRIAHELYIPAVARAYGELGVLALREVINGLKRVYKFLGPEQIRGTFIMVRSLEPNGDYILTSITPKQFNNPEYLAQECMVNNFIDKIIIQLKPNGDFFFWKTADIDIVELSQKGVVYVYQDKRECFLVQGTEHTIYNPSPAHVSVFAIPTFHELGNALTEYKHRMIRTSQCKIFSNAWDGGEESDRLFFRNKPESIIRRSLTQFLKIVLRSAEVRPEQIVDETHPVDIKVTWMFANRIALIEIKWLGKSINETRQITQTFTEARAREGASQLSNYLDLNRGQVPTHQTWGYLIVIDARRRWLNEASISVDRGNGFWYEGREVVYNPEYHNARSDFAEPIRMFVEPICKQN